MAPVRTRVRRGLRAAGRRRCTSPRCRNGRRGRPGRATALPPTARPLAVVDARGVAGGHGAAVLEGGLQLSELLDGGPRARMLVLADELGAVVHGLDLAGEEAISSRARVPILTARRIAILLGPTDVLLLRDVLRRLAERDWVIAEVDHARVHESPSEGRVHEDTPSAREGF